MLTRGETFLERIESKEKKRILEAYLEKKKSSGDKDRAKRIADIAREVSECEYVNIDGTPLTIGEILVAQAYANEMNNPKANFVSLNAVQKVIDSDTDSGQVGFTVNFITNGQDLGD